MWISKAKYNVMVTQLKDYKTEVNEYENNLTRHSNQFVDLRNTNENKLREQRAVYEERIEKLITTQRDNQWQIMKLRGYLKNILTLVPEDKYQQQLLFTLEYVEILEQNFGHNNGY